MNSFDPNCLLYWRFYSLWVYHRLYMWSLLYWCEWLQQFVFLDSFQYYLVVIIEVLVIILSVSDFSCTHYCYYWYYHHHHHHHHLLCCRRPLLLPTTAATGMTIGPTPPHLPASRRGRAMNSIGLISCAHTCSLAKFNKEAGWPCSPPGCGWRSGWNRRSKLSFKRQVRCYTGPCRCRSMRS